MTLVFKAGKIEIWQASESYGFDFYVYGVTRDPLVCPSLSMARARAGV